MNNIDDVLNKIYDEVLSDLLTSVEDSYIDLVKEGYRNYLNKQYKDEYEDYPDFNKLYNVLVGIEKSAWSNISINDKLRSFVKDEALLELEKLSFQALKMAKDKMEKDLTTLESETSELITSMEEYHSKVLPFNQDYAKELLSEGLLDLEYACGKTSNQSFRISNQIMFR